MALTTVHASQSASQVVCWGHQYVLPGQSCVQLSFISLHLGIACACTVSQQLTNIEYAIGPVLAAYIATPPVVAHVVQDDASRRVMHPGADMTLNATLSHHSHRTDKNGDIIWFWYKGLLQTMSSGRKHQGVLCGTACDACSI